MIVWLKADGSTAAQKKLASTAQPAGARKRRNTSVLVTCSVFTLAYFVPEKRVVPQTPRLLLTLLSSPLFTNCVTQAAMTTARRKTHLSR